MNKGIDYVKLKKNFIKFILVDPLLHYHQRQAF